MNNHSKRLIRDLEALGFERDDESSSRRKGKHVFRHANDPSQCVKVQEGMSDNGRTYALKLANKIADTGSTGPRQPQTIKERAAITRRKQTAHEQRVQAERDERAAKAEREYEKREAARKAAAQRREIEQLMQPGFGR